MHIGNELSTFSNTVLFTVIIADMVGCFSHSQNGSQNNSLNYENSVQMLFYYNYLSLNKNTQISKICYLGRIDYDYKNDSSSEISFDFNIFGKFGTQNSY